MIYKQTLQKDKYIKFSKFKFILFISLVFMLGYSFTFFKKVDRKTKIIKVTIDKTVNSTDSFTLEYFKNYVSSLNLKHPDIVIAQAIHETGYFTSNIFKENNNLFGMKKAYQRPTTCIDVNRGHAVYSNWKNSVIDYALWQSKYGNYSNKNDYFKYLNTCYAEDKNYIKNLKLIIKENE